MQLGNLVFGGALQLVAILSAVVLRQGASDNGSPLFRGACREGRRSCGRALRRRRCDLIVTTDQDPAQQAPVPFAGVQHRCIGTECAADEIERLRTKRAKKMREKDHMQSRLAVEEEVDQYDCFKATEVKSLGLTQIDEKIVKRKLVWLEFFDGHTKAIYRPAKMKKFI